LDLSPAPLFLRRRHLTKRMHSILTEVSMSRFRLLFSYASMAAILVLAGSLALRSFPLVGAAQLSPARTPPADTTFSVNGITVNPGGTLVGPRFVAYPSDAIQKHIEGAVFAELTVNSAGNVTDARVMSGPDELRKAVLQSVLQWRYASDAAASRTIVVSLDFRTPPTNDVQPAPFVVTSPSNVRESARGQRGVISGVLGGVVAGNPELNTLNGLQANIDVTGVAEPLRTQLWQRLQALQGQPFTPALNDQLKRILAGSNQQAYVKLGAGKANITISPFPPTAANPDLVGEVALIVAPPPPPPPPPPPFPSSDAPRTQASPESQNAKLVQKATPVYPPLARAARVTGAVVLAVLVGTDGHVAGARVVSGHALLTDAALHAVEQWVYSPTIVNGQPTEVETMVTVNFQFQ
jgi:TonB family protein